ncbi:putative protease Do-like 14 [Silene latifolia]|uniref:putative protease Do-like 14 n=1 Tax=Silene latifolia TaxID=37657 RepID=UPI003D78A8E7
MSKTFNLVGGGFLLMQVSLLIAAWSILIPINMIVLNYYQLDCGDGAPVVNISGEVFGISYYDLGAASPFLPMNVAFKWWNHYKQFEYVSRRPLYGFAGSQLYLAFLPFIKRYVGTFPDFTNGVQVEKILQGSYAQSAGLLEDDVIVECDGKPVKSFLQLWELMWDKASDVVELEVARVSVEDTISINLVVGEVKSDELNKWPCYDYK